LALTLGTVLAAATGCDGAVPSVDASAPMSAHVSAVSLRIDVSAAQPPSLSVLAFRAAFSGVLARDVLGMVDPLAADAPSRDCQLRYVGKATEALVARGDAIELEELTGIGISVAANAPEISPSPRIYPDLLATIGGVVSESGPLGLAAVPEQIQVRRATTALASQNPSAAAPQDTTTMSVPVAGWLKLMNGTVPTVGLPISASSDLTLSLTPPDATDTSVELRPLGGLVALNCAVPPSTVPGGAGGAQMTFMVPRQALAVLLSASDAPTAAPVSASLDLVRRSSKSLPLSETRVSLEVRTSTVVELRP
jgi:hypothetical protein